MRKGEITLVFPAAAEAQMKILTAVLSLFHLPLSSSRRRPVREEAMGEVSRKILWIVILHAVSTTSAAVDNTNTIAISVTITIYCIPYHA